MRTPTEAETGITALAASMTCHGCWLDEQMVEAYLEQQRIGGYATSAADGWIADGLGFRQQLARWIAAGDENYGVEAWAGVCARHQAAMFWHTCERYGWAERGAVHHVAPAEPTPAEPVPAAVE